MQRFRFESICVLSLILGLFALATADLRADEAASGSGGANALKFTMKNIDGQDVSLNEKYAGKVVMVVNVASRCGLTPQYEQLQALHAKYNEQGLAIVGFPCNQFGKQEPDSESDIKTFCSQNYNVKFDLFAKVNVNGPDACDLYKHLTGLQLPPKGEGDISWNFEKFIVNRKGEVVARFAPKTKPDADEVIAVIEAELQKSGSVRVNQD